MLPALHFQLGHAILGLIKQPCCSVLALRLLHGSVQHVILFRGRAATLQPQGWYYSPCCACRAVFPSFAFTNYRPAVYIINPRWRPYRVECTGSLPTSEVKRRRARLVLGWGTAREDLRVLPALLNCKLVTSSNLTSSVFYRRNRFGTRPQEQQPITRKRAQR